MTLPNKFGEFVLDGLIFRAEGLPVEAAAELIAYKALILDVAKQLYLRENPGRVRSKRNLATDFDLRLIKIDRGSADVQMVLPVADPVGQLTLIDSPNIRDYFDKSRDLVSDTISHMALTRQLAPVFPLKSLTKFRALGKTLPDGHELRLASPQGNHRSVMTPKVREDFLKVLDANATEMERETSGTIVELDPERTIFHLRTTDGDRIQCFYGSGVGVGVDRSFLADESGEGPTVIIKGVALVGRDKVLQRFVEVTAVTGPDPIEIERESLLDHVDELSGIAPGWMGPDSLAITPAVKASVTEALQGLTRIPAALGVAPLPDGGLRFEWSEGPVEYVAEAEADGGLYLCILPELSHEDDDVQLEEFNVARFTKFVEDGNLG